MTAEEGKSCWGSLQEALQQGHYPEALELCQALLARWPDCGLAELRNALRNLVKDRQLQANLRRFIQEYRQKMPPREATFRPEVVIPCFNQGRFLGEALASVSGRAPVTVINDASTDETAEHIARLSRQFQFKLLVNPVNLNQAGSLNRAVAESGSNLFIVLNADDALVCYAIPAILDTFAANGEIRMAGGNCIPFAEPDEIKCCVLPEILPYRPQPALYYPADAAGFCSPNDLNLTMSSCSFLRSAWEAAGGFWEFERRVCSFDDRDFQMRVCALFPVAVLSEPLAFYRVSSSVGRGRSV